MLSFHVMPLFHHLGHHPSLQPHSIGVFQCLLQAYNRENQQTEMPAFSSFSLFLLPPSLSLFFPEKFHVSFLSGHSSSSHAFSYCRHFPSFFLQPSVIAWEGRCPTFAPLQNDPIYIPPPMITPPQEWREGDNRSPISSFQPPLFIIIREDYQMSTFTSLIFTSSFTIMKSTLYFHIIHVAWVWMPVPK